MSLFYLNIFNKQNKEKRKANSKIISTVYVPTSWFSLDLQSIYQSINILGVLTFSFSAK